MNKTSIEWTASDDGKPGYSSNPLKARRLDTGKAGWHCERLSPGCEHCYSEASNIRFGTGLPYTAGSTPQVEVFVDWGEVAAILKRDRLLGKAGEHARCFVFDMTDLFAKFVPDETIAAMFGVFAACRNLTFQVLTKRAARMADWFNQAAFRMIGRYRIPILIEHAARQAQVDGHQTVADRLFALANANASRDFWPLPWVWPGVSVEDQRRANERITHLLMIPSAVRFLSVEPLLEAVNLGLWRVEIPRHREHWPVERNNGFWVICGGESGPRRRPMDLAWARSIRDQCAAAGVPFFMKQIDKRIPIPNDLMIREFPGAAARLAETPGEDTLHASWWPTQSHPNTGEPT